MAFIEDLKRRLRRAARRSPVLTGAYGRASSLYHRSRMRVAGAWGALAADARVGPNPANMVWIFGSGRSGSTWLRSMMGEMGGHRVWEEPMVGGLFVEFYARTPKENLRSADFIMGDPIRKGWTRSVRNFVLDGAGYSNPGLEPGDHLIVKEPNGFVGVPLLMEALPESCMIFLIQDPRDVIASVLDATREGGWHQERFATGAVGRRALADRRPDAFVRLKTKAYLRSVGGARRAYESHRGKKVLVRYEDLVANPLGIRRRVYADRGIPADEGELSRAVGKHSWANVPEEKGEGKFYRKGTPGSWRKDTSLEQTEIIQEIAAPFLEEFYAGRERGQG